MTDLTYEQALHAIQTGIAYEIERGSTASTPKHLRVGVDSAMVTHAALAWLLVKKGVFTEEEYAEAIRLEANREVARYEHRISELYGVKVTLR
jgi:hypothetical protein